MVCFMASVAKFSVVIVREVSMVSLLEVLSSRVDLNRGQLVNPLELKWNTCLSTAIMLTNMNLQAFLRFAHTMGNWSEPNRMVGVDSARYDC